MVNHLVFFSDKTCFSPMIKVSVFFFVGAAFFVIEPDVLPSILYKAIIEKTNQKILKYVTILINLPIE